MFSKILVALDHSTVSQALFDQALYLAQGMQSDVMLLHVLSDEESDSPRLPLHGSADGYPVYFEHSMWDTYNQHWAAYEKRGLEQLQRYAAAARQSGLQVEFSQNAGHPGKTICQVANNWNADLIMVGNRGRSGLSELLLGSVSNYVMHHAPCSVLVEHADKQRVTSEPYRQIAAL